MNLALIKFRFAEPLHIGTVRADYDSSQSMIHSDTLYSAIIQAWSVLGLLEKTKNYTQPKEHLGFTLSSLFPFYQKDKSSEAIYFFPKPIGAIPPTDYTTSKKVKKIQYLDTGYFKKLLEKGEIEKPEEKAQGIYLTDNDDFKEKDINGELTEGEGRTFMQKKVFPRVYVPRTGEVETVNNRLQLLTDTRIYYIERLFFKGESGLFCLVKLEGKGKAREINKERLKAAIKLLGDEGLGTDRRVGNGRFDIDFEVDFIDNFTEFDQLPSSKHQVNLSLFCPKDSQVLSQSLVRYEIIKRGGWITADNYLTYRKNAIYMFKEGSIFKSGTSPEGKTVDLAPKKTPRAVQHPIYRVGHSLFLPFQFKN